jgi:hypothetical protein
MHILYLDESGNSKSPGEKYFVLAGVSVPETSVRWLSHQLNKVAQTLEPTRPEEVELHAAEIFRGAITPWKEMTRPQRIQSIKSVLQVLNDAHSTIKLFAVAIHKNSFPEEDVVLKSYERIASAFNNYIEHLPDKEKQLGIIVIDKSSYEEGLQELAASIRREGNRWGSYNKSICEVPLFVDSRAARIIQLADHIAYAVYRRYNAEDLAYFNLIDSRFDQSSDGVMHGLIHYQTYIRNCTCPACITRKLTSPQ